MIYIVYKDDGPAGHTGQGVQTTQPRTELITVLDYDQYRSLRQDIEDGVGYFIRRVNPRIAETFADFTSQEDGTVFDPVWDYYSDVTVGGMLYHSY